MAVSSLVPAASGPTLAEIQTAVSTYSTPYNGTWTDLGSTNFTGSSTATITGLSGYKQLKLFLWLSPSTSVIQSMRVNGDTTTNYAYGHASASIQAEGYAVDNMRLASGTGGTVIGILTISPANSTSSKKMITAENYQVASTPAVFAGTYLGTSAITSVTFFLNTGTFSTGRVQIWGLN